MKKQCTGCAVSAGTHKPAEVLHQKIEEPQAEALRLADECEESAAHWALEIDTRLNAAKMLSAQHAHIEDIEAQHREELRAYEITVANREARIAELEAKIETGKRLLREEMDRANRYADASKARRVQLSDEYIRDIYAEESHWDIVAPYVIEFARAIERAHGITQEKHG